MITILANWVARAALQLEIILFANVLVALKVKCVKWTEERIVHSSRVKMVGNVNHWLDDMVVTLVNVPRTGVGKLVSYMIHNTVGIRQRYR